MNIHRSTRISLLCLALGALWALLAPAAPAQTPENNVRKAQPWKQFDYTCNGGAKLTVFLRADLAKVRYQDHVYLMRQTKSADGNRYSDGKIVWWGKGNGGFLQEDTPEWNGKMILEGCQLDKPLGSSSSAASGTVSGTVTYLQRMALPSNAVLDVQLRDVSLADAPSQLIARQKITLSGKQVPVPFSINFDPAKIDPKHTYSVSAKITVDGALRFITDTSNPVLTQGHPAQVELTLKPISGPKPGPA